MNPYLTGGSSSNSKKSATSGVIKARGLNNHLDAAGTSRHGHDANFHANAAAGKALGQDGTGKNFFTVPGANPQEKACQDLLSAACAKSGPAQAQAVRDALNATLQKIETNFNGLATAGAIKRRNLETEIVANQGAVARGISSLGKALHKAELHAIWSGSEGAALKQRIERVCTFNAQLQNVEHQKDKRQGELIAAMKNQCTVAGC